MSPAGATHRDACPRRAFVLALALGLVAFAGTTAHAQAPADALERCSEQLLALARGQGAERFQPDTRDFLMSGQQRAYEFRLETEGCLHIAALGHRNIQDLDLALYDPSGRKLATDRGRTAHPYASFCGGAGRGVIAHLHMRDGDGEVQLVSFRGGPRRLQGVEAAAASCQTSGSPRPPPIDVGEEPPGPSLEQGLVTLASELFELGYRETPILTFGALSEQRREARRIPLQGDRCYALVALGSPGVADVDLRVFAPLGNDQLVGADVTRRRDAVARMCTDAEGAYLLDVSMFRGAGTYLVKAFELEERVARPQGVEGAARVAYQELATRMAQRGLTLQAEGWSLVRPDVTDRVPLPVAAGDCYALAAVGSTELGGGLLDLTLLDDRGSVVATRQGSSPPPMLFHCAERSGIYRMAARSPELRHPARYLWLVGREGAP